MSCNMVKHFFLAGCWRNESILPGPGDILRLTDLLARDRLLCLPSAAPFPFSSSLARSMALLSLLSSAVCLPACMLSQPDETRSLLSVCLVSRWAVSHHDGILSLQQQSLPHPPAACWCIRCPSPPRSAGKHVPACRSPPCIAHLSAQHPPPPCQGGSSRAS